MTKDFNFYNIKFWLHVVVFVWSSSICFKLWVVGQLCVFFLAKWDGYWHGIMESLESLGFF